MLFLFFVVVHSQLFHVSFPQWSLANNEGELHCLVSLFSSKLCHWV